MGAVEILSPDLSTRAEPRGVYEENQIVARLCTKVNLRNLWIRTP